MTQLTAPLLLRAYAMGIFPMAENAESTALFWFDPERRGVLPLDRFHLPHRLRRTVRQRRFEVRIDSAFKAVIAGCAEATSARPKTWINAEIQRLYGELHRAGFAHSVECWRDGRLVGGLYGVAIGGAFFGGSMFSRRRRRRSPRQKARRPDGRPRSGEDTAGLQSPRPLACRL